MISQIFISYRRDGGDVMAQLLSEKLIQKGYTVFYDIESLQSGRFDDRILRKIEECDDFILVLPKNALDRCANNDDWVRIEIAHALKLNKNIIPIILRGFVFPSKLPDDISSVSKYNGIIIETMDFLNAKIEKMISLFNSQPKSVDSPTPPIDEQLDHQFKDLFSNKEDGETESSLVKKINQKAFSDYLASIYIVSNPDIKTNILHKNNMFSSSHVEIEENSFSLITKNDIELSIYAVYEKTKYDYRTLTAIPNITMEKLDKICTSDNGSIVTEFNINRDGAEYKLICLGIDKKKCIAYIHYLGNIFTSTKPNHEDRYNFIKLNNIDYQVFYYKDKLLPNKSKQVLSGSDNTKYFETPNFETIIIDPEECEIILKEIYVDRNKRQRARIRLNPSKNYISCQLKITDANIREMTNMEIAKCYHRGLSAFPKSKIEAINYFEKDNSAESYYELGDIFANSTDIHNDEMALEYMLKSAELGFEKAMLESIEMLRNGIGCVQNEVNYKKAIKISKKLSQKNSVFRYKVVKCYYFFAEWYKCDENYTQAEKLYKYTLNICKKLNNMKSSDYILLTAAHCYIDIASIYISRKLHYEKYEKIVSMYIEAVSFMCNLSVKTLLLSHKIIISYIELIIIIYNATNRSDKANKLNEKISDLKSLAEIYETASGFGIDMSDELTTFCKMLSQEL